VAFEEAENRSAPREAATELHAHFAPSGPPDAVSLQAVEYVRRGQAAGAIRDGDPALLIALAFGAFVGLVKEADQGHFALDEAALDAGEAAVWGLLARPGAARTRTPDTNDEGRTT